MARKDRKITKRMVRCPNATLLGYATREARPGDVLSYKEHYAGGDYGTRLARVVGRVDADGTDGVQIKGHLCVVALSDDGTACYERWVDPKDVIEINRPCPKFWAHFMSADPRTLLDESASGAATASHMDYWREP